MPSIEADVSEESSTSTLQDQDEQVRRPQDDAAESPPQPEDEQSTSHVEGTEKPEGKPKDDKDSDSATSQSDELIQSLVKPEQRKKPAEAKPAEKSQEKPKQEEAKQPAGAQEKSDKDDPFDGLSRDDIKIKTRERIVTLHKRATTAETKLAEREQSFEKREPFAKTGENYSKLFEHYGLNDDLDLVSTDDFAGAIRANAAGVRAEEAISQGYMPRAEDLAILDSLKEPLDALYEKMGKGNSLKPITGKLPDDLAELVEGGFVTEERARLLAAIEAKENPPRAKAKPTQPTELREQPPLRPQQRQSQPQQQQPSTSQREENTAWSMIAAHLSKSGVSPTEIPNHFNKNLTPIIVRLISEELPGTNPSDVPPSFRVEFARRAQAEFAEKSKPKAPSKQPAQQGQSLRATGHVGGKHAASGEPDDGLSYAVSFLTRPK